LRVIGGEWRGRKLRFPATRDGIRPTPDRVRETLFNWLQGRIVGSRCLDLFAGSGALGIEALSRGAAEVVFVESDEQATKSLRQVLAQLNCNRATVVTANAMSWLRGAAQPFDIAFLDPPYSSGVLGEVSRKLVERGWLAPDARLYLEQPAAAATPELPGGWSLLRSKRAGEVGYHLAGPTATDAG
jgi:16S rRNA (guanine966-N2)-methyltransferase